MKSRMDKFKKNKATRRMKILLATVLLSLSVGSGVKVAFADQDIESLLTNWFSQKKTESISGIEKSISSEKEIQKQRLKEELQLKIEEANQQLSQFTEEQKQQRTAAIRKYADDLIANLTIDNSGKEKQISKDLDAIVEQAITEMNQVTQTSQSTDPHPKGGGKGTGQ